MLPLLESSAYEVGQWVGRAFVGVLVVAVIWSAVRGARKARARDEEERSGF